MSTPWQIALLGGLRAEREGVVVAHFRSQKIGALLAYLALFSERVHVREEVAGLLWPEADPDVGRTNLRTALSHLRKLLEPDGVAPGSVLIAEGRHQIGISPAWIRVDVHRFERQLTGASTLEELKEAVDLYSGPLLPGRYEPWMLAERDRLAERYFQAMDRLIALHEAHGQIPRALDLAWRALAAEPLREASHAVVLRLLHAQGRPEAARKHFKDLESLFRRELESEPSPELRQIAELRVAAPPSLRPPPAPAAASPPHLLPAALGPLFGRERELARLTELLCSPGCRLVTLCGPGGIGKTRLSLETAHALSEKFPGGAWFVPLAEVHERVAEAVAEGIGLAPDASAPASERLREELLQRGRSGPLLLVLDNAEQIVEPVATLLEGLLAQVPALTCLVTSRQKLLLDGEAELSLTPLPTPTRPADPEELRELPSVQLFLHRARRTHADFQLTERNADSIARLCAQLEGIPLALELAAAWAHTLTPTQMLERLAPAPDRTTSRRFDLLVARRHGVEERHASLRSAVAWSWGLLPQDLQRFFARLSVFSDGWTLEAAEAVTGEPNALEFLTELRERSLILTEETDDIMRFRMLETLREFAIEQCSPDDSIQIKKQHLTHFLALAESAAAHLQGAEQTAWRAVLDAERGNSSAALSFAIATGDGSGERRLIKALWRYWVLRGRTSEARVSLRNSFSRDDIPEGERAFLLSAGGSLAGVQGDYQEAQALLEESLALLRRQDNSQELAQALCGLGTVVKCLGQYDVAIQYLTESAELCRALGDRRGIVRASQNLGNLYNEQGELQKAERLYQESLHQSELIGDIATQGMVHHNLGDNYLRQGNGRRAEEHLHKSLEIRQAQGDLLGIGVTLSGLGTIAHQQGERERAGDHYAEALVSLRAAGARDGMVMVLLNQLELLLDDDTQSLGRTQEILHEMIALLQKGGLQRYRACAIELAARIATLRGETDRAARLWGASTALRERIGALLIDPEQLESDRHFIQGRSLHGDEAAFDRAVAAGRLLTDEEALALSLA